MSTERTEAVGPYSLVARQQEDLVRGVIWLAGKKVEDCSGTSVDAVFDALRDRVGELMHGAAEQRVGPPAQADTLGALRRVIPKMTPAQVRMLRAHFVAPDQRITATQLADAAQYESYRAANLHYGQLGYLLYVELPTPLPRRESDGKLIYTCSLAEEEDQRGEDEAEWVWKMRPHVAAALGALKFS